MNAIAPSSGLKMARQDGSLGWIGIANIPSACREGSRLERAFRDMYTGTQHAFISEKTYTEAGSLLLGLVEDSMAL